MEWRIREHELGAFVGRVNNGSWELDWCFFFWGGAWRLAAWLHGTGLENRLWVSFGYGILGATTAWSERVWVIIAWFFSVYILEL